MGEVWSGENPLEKSRRKISTNDFRKYRYLWIKMIGYHNVEDRESIKQNREGGAITWAHGTSIIPSLEGVVGFFRHTKLNTGAEPFWSGINKVWKGERREIPSSALDFTNLERVKRWLVQLARIISAAYRTEKVEGVVGRRSIRKEELDN